MQLQDFKFPVIERPIAVYNGQHDLIDLENEQTFLHGDYKAIVREDNNQLISVVRSSYNLLPNATLIDQLMTELLKIDTPYYIDPSHSFVDNQRMRLQITFPEILMKDEDSEIALSLFLHNSYDMSEGIRMFWGAIRGICSNGMVFGKLLSKFYGRHTKGFDIFSLRRSLTETYETLPALQERISQLESMAITSELEKEIETHLGKRLAKKVRIEEKASQWALLNSITYFISHQMEQRHRARYQLATSRIFQL